MTHPTDSQSGIDRYASIGSMAWPPCECGQAVCPDSVPKVDDEKVRVAVTDTNTWHRGRN